MKKDTLINLIKVFIAIVISNCICYVIFINRPQVRHYVFMEEELNSLMENDVSLEKRKNIEEYEKYFYGIKKISYTYDMHSDFFIDAMYSSLIIASLNNKTNYFDICEYIYDTNRDIEYAKKYGAYPYVKINKTKQIKNLTMCGDSYAGLLNDYLSRYYSMYREGFVRAGKTLEENLKFYKGAMRSNFKYVFLSIGVNDHINQVPLDKFEKKFDELLQVAYINKKKVYIHSFINYGDDVDHEKKYTSTLKYKTYMYDVIIQKLASKYDNVFYVDCRDIGKLEYLKDDKLHFNMYFYNKLVKRMLDAIK